MDDHSFDKFIKGKLDGYEDPSFDPAALEGFHSKLGLFRPAPWYASQLTHYMMAASLTLFTVINLYLFWPGMENESILSKEKKTIDSLNTVIAQLNQQRPAVTGMDSAMINQLVENAVRNQLNEAKAQRPAYAPNSSGSMLFLGPVKNLSPDVYHALVVRRMLVIDNDNAYMIAPEKEAIATRRSPAGYNETTIADVYPEQPVSIAPFSLQSKNMLAQTKVTQLKKTNQLSSKQKTALEKHYFKGIGINVAPHADLIYSAFNSASGALAPRLGATAEFVVSPRLSVEAGADYTPMVMNFDKNVQAVQLPTEEPSLGNLQAVTIRTKLVSAPVAIKYRQWLTEKTQGFIKVGYTPYVSLGQEYKCGYDQYNPLNGPGGNGQFPPPYTTHRVNSVQERTGTQYFGGNSTVSVGLAKVLPNKNKLEAALLYEKSISPVGTENLNMQLFGVRAAYWFNLR